MKITFTTKEEQNKTQQEHFLALTPSERVIRFFFLSRQLKFFPKKVQFKSSNPPFEINMKLP